MSYDSEVLADSPLIYPKFDDILSDYMANGGSDPSPWRYGSVAVVNKTPVLSDGGKGAGTSAATAGTMLGFSGKVPAFAGNPNMSMELWVDVPAGNHQGLLFEIGNGNVPDGWGVGISSGTLSAPGRNIQIFTNGFSYGDLGVQYAVGKNQIVVARGTGTTFVVYLNGVSISTAGFHPSLATGKMLMTLGEAMTTGLTLDSFALFPSQLSAARVTAHYNSGNGSNSAIAADNPVTWLKMDETTYSAATSVADSSGNGRSLSLVGYVNPGAPAPTAYIGGGSAGFGGWGGNSATTNFGFLRVPTPSWAASLTAMSFEAWFRTGNNFANSTIASMDNVIFSPGSSARKFGLNMATNGQVSWQDFTSAGGAPICTTPLGYNDLNWHHVVATRDSTTIRIYMDGNTTPVATAALGGTVASGISIDLLIGALNWGGGYGNQWHGEISHPALYGTTLAPSRVAAHFNAAQIPADNFHAYWGMLLADAS